MLYKFESEVTKALGELLESRTNYDVIIYVGEKPDFNYFFYLVDPFTLMKYSLLITLKKKDGKYTIKKPIITPQAFNIIIK